MRKNSVSSCIALALAIALSGPAFGGQTVRISDSPSGVTLLGQSDNGLTLNVAVGAIDFADVLTREGPFVMMTVSSFAHSQQVGEPNLPVAGKLISIPYGCRLSATVINSEVQELSLSSLGLTNPIIPVQPSLSKSDDPTSVPFEFKRAVYEQRGYYALPPVDVKVAGTMRGVRLGRVSVAPIQYDPVGNKLRVYTSLTVRISFDGADWALTDEQRKKYYSPFFEPLYAGLINYGDQVPAVRDDLVTHPVKYLIISDPMFADQLQPFIEWKTRKGFTIITAYTNVIGSSNSAIKSYIESLYDAGTVEDPAPSFVLFVGDAQQIPAWSGSAGYHITDLRYCEFSSPSDDFPEIYYGRFSAQNTAELQPQIDKTLEYEQYLMPDPSYLAEVTLVSGVDHSYASTFGNGQINYGTDYYFNAAHGITPHVWLYPASDASGAAAAIIQTISDGAGFYNYTAHCNHAGHANPPFTTADIPDLTNYHQYLLGIGNCCLPNTFGTDYSTPCFGEAFLQVADKGGIGYIGGTNSTFWDEDYWWGVGSGPIIGSGPTYEETGQGAYDGIFHDHGEPISQHYIANSAIIFAGNMGVTEAGSDLQTYYWEIYHLMGDPSVMTYMGVPAVNSVSHDAVLLVTATSTTVEADPGSYVGISVDGELQGAGYVDGSGSVEIALAGFDTPCMADIVITGQNRQPYVSTIEVITPSGPYVMYDYSNIDDGAGNGNGLVENGESIVLGVGLVNFGSGDANDVAASISTSDGYVTITDGEEGYGTISSGGGAGYVSSAFSFDVSGDVPDGHEVTFDLEVTSAGRETWYGSIDILVYAPCLEFVSYQMDDSLGNEDGVLDPGERGELVVTLANVGSGAAYSVVGSLLEADEYVSL
ncbi:MAG: hypothetical protein KAU35_06680, partial [candidate division Zixibacteria bacterium]|nr:hypothetical protein [candidate division Zixibacteria bacterium]